MKIHLCALGALVAVIAIGCDPPVTHVKTNPHPDGGTVETECASGFCVGTFDPSGLYPAPSYSASIAVAQKGDTLGIAYYSPRNTTDGGYEIYYRSWTNGAVSNAELVQTVDKVQGIAIAFQPSGEPAVTYQGGDDDGQNLASWKNSDACISNRTNGTWTEHIAVNAGDEAIAGNGPSDFGPVVGVYSAIGFDSAGKAFFSYRDNHAGQFEVQDYAKSDMEIAEGGLSSWTHTVLLSGGVTPSGWGGNPRMVMVNDLPAISSTSALHNATAPGIDVWFMRRLANNTWTSAVKALGVGDTHSAPSLAYDSTAGYGIAVTELQNTQRLTYITSPTGAGGTWSDPVGGVVYENGSGGWFPSLAYDPATHTPHIAFYVCALTLGVTEGNCPASEDELQIAVKTPTRWDFKTVDTGGAFQPWLFFLSNGKRVLVYRDVRSADLKVALEQ